MLIISKPGEKKQLIQPRSAMFSVWLPTPPCGLSSAQCQFGDGLPSCVSPRAWFQLPPMQVLADRAGQVWARLDAVQPYGSSLRFSLRFLLCCPVADGTLPAGASGSSVLPLLSPEARPSGLHQAARGLVLRGPSGTCARLPVALCCSGTVRSVLTHLCLLCLLVIQLKLIKPSSCHRAVL